MRENEKIWENIKIQRFLCLFLISVLIIIQCTQVSGADALEEVTEVQEEEIPEEEYEIVQLEEAKFLSSEKTEEISLTEEQTKESQAETEETKSSIYLDATYFPDEVFRAYIGNLMGKTEGDELSQIELDAVKTINLGGTTEAYHSCKDLTGIKYFENLEKLNCSYGELEELDLSCNHKLIEVRCENNQIVELILPNAQFGNTTLEFLLCGWNQLTRLDLSKFSGLKYLYCYQMVTLNGEIYLSPDADLILINCGNTGLTSITEEGKFNINDYPNLEQFQCYNMSMGTLDFSELVKLKVLNVAMCGLTELDVSKNTELEWLICNNNYITELDLSNNTEVTWIECGWNYLTRLDISGLAKLERFTGASQRSRTLLMYYDAADTENPVWVNMALDDDDIAAPFSTDKGVGFFEIAYDENNYMCAGTALSTSDFKINSDGYFMVSEDAKNPGSIYFYEELLIHEDAPINTSSEYEAALSGTFSYQTSKLSAETVYMDLHEARELTDVDELLTYFQTDTVNWESKRISCAEFEEIQKGTLGQYKVYITYMENGKSITVVDILEVGVEINLINFPDAYFRAYLTNEAKGFDYETEGKGFFTKAELENVKKISVEGTRDDRKEFYSVEGIGYFSNLEYVGVVYANIESVDLHENTKLEFVDFGENQDLGEVNLKNLSNVTYLSLWGVGKHGIKHDLDLSDLTELKELNLGYAGLETLDLSHNTKLESLYCHGNELTQLDVSNCPELKILNCGMNHLTSITLNENATYEEKFDASNQTLGMLSLYPDESGAYYVNVTRGASDTAVTFINKENAATSAITLKKNNQYGNSLYDADSFYADEQGRLTVGRNVTNPGLIYFATEYKQNGSTIGTLSGTFTYETSDISISDAYIDHNDARTLTSVKGLLNGNYFQVMKNVSGTDTPVDAEQLSITCTSDEFALIKAGTLGSYTVTIAYTADGKTESRQRTLEVGVRIDAVNFPDSTLCAHVERFDTEKNGADEGFLKASELQAVVTMDLCGKAYSGEYGLGDKELMTVNHLCGDTGVTCTNIQGLEYFTNLKELYMGKVGYTGVLDLRKLEALQYLHCMLNDGITEVNVSGMTALKQIKVSQNKNLTSLKVSGCTSMKKIEAEVTGISELNVSDLKQLEEIGFDTTFVSKVDVSGLKKLKVLYARSCTKLQSVDVTGCTSLKYLNVRNSGLKELDLSTNIALTQLYCGKNDLTALAVDHLVNLTDIDCSENHLTTLNLSNLRKLSSVDATDQTVEKDLAMSYDGTKWIPVEMDHMEPLRTFYYHEGSPMTFYAKTAGGTLLSDFTVAADGTLNAASVFELVEPVYFKAAPVDANGKTWTNSLTGTFGYAPQFTLSAGTVAFCSTAIIEKLQNEATADALCDVNGLIQSNANVEELKKVATINMVDSDFMALKAGSAGSYTYKLTVGNITATGQIDVYEDSQIGADSLLVIPATIRMTRDYTQNQAVAEASVKLYANAEKNVTIQTADSVKLMLGASTTEMLTAEVYTVASDATETRYDGTGALAVLSPDEEQRFKLKTQTLEGFRYGDYQGTMEFTIRYHDDE